MADWWDCKVPRRQVHEMADVYLNCAREFVRELRRHDIAMPLVVSDAMHRMESVDAPLHFAIQYEAEADHAQRLLSADMIERGECP